MARRAALVRFIIVLPRNLMAIMPLVLLHLPMQDCRNLQHWRRWLWRCPRKILHWMPMLHALPMFISQQPIPRRYGIRRMIWTPYWIRLTFTRCVSKSPSSNYRSLRKLRWMRCTKPPPGWCWIRIYRNSKKFDLQLFAGLWMMCSIVKLVSAT